MRCLCGIVPWHWFWLQARVLRDWALQEVMPDDLGGSEVGKDSSSSKTRPLCCICLAGLPVLTANVAMEVKWKSGFDSADSSLPNQVRLSAALPLTNRPSYNFFFRRFLLIFQTTQDPAI